MKFHLSQHPPSQPAVASRPFLDAIMPASQTTSSPAHLAGKVASSALTAALNALSDPAFIVRLSPLEIVRANASGQLALASNTEAVIAGVAGAARDPAGTGGALFVSLDEHGGKRHALIVLRDQSNTLDRRLQHANDGWSLTRRQTQILGLLVRGSSNKEIGGALECATKTVEKHVGAVLAKAGVTSRAELLSSLLRLDFGPDQLRVNPHIQVEHGRDRAASTPFHQAPQLQSGGHSHGLAGRQTGDHK